MRRTCIYARESRLNALVAAGHAHLATNDLEAAMHAFGRALETTAENGRALAGLAQACARSGAAAEAMAPRVEASTAALTRGGRGAEAAQCVRLSIACALANTLPMIGTVA